MTRNHSHAFHEFKVEYNNALVNFLNLETSSEKNLQEGKRLAQKAIEEDLGILSITAIHHDCLNDFLVNLNSGEHSKFANKADIFLEEVLSPLNILKNEFREAVGLLNKTNIESAEQIKALQISIKEKEALLKEVYHRVKNNLQVISSLLNLQIETTKSPSAQRILIESAARVRSMSLVHEMLYQTENLAEIEMEEYVDNLFKYLQKIYNIDTNRIKLTKEIDAISLNIDMAIPLGLIINEMISNSFKHAFPDKKSGTIQLTLKKHDKTIVLKTVDNGIGIPPELNIEDMTTLGMQLIFNLTKQLGGQIELKRDNGTTLTLSIPTNTK